MNELQAAEFAAEIRDGLASVAEVAWKARDADLDLNQTLEIVLPAAEEFVQSIVRTAS